MVVFGTWTTKWDLLYEADYLKKKHADDKCCKEAVNVFNPHQLSSIDEWMWHPDRGQRFRAVLHGNKSPPWFLEAILVFSSRKCLNLRDKIYSMLSLATHPSYQGFRPDYQEDVSTVYPDIFTRMVRETDGSFS